MLQEYPIYIGGEFVTTSTPLDVRSPFSKQKIARTFQGDKEELEFAISRAMKVKKTLAEQPSYKRYQILQQIAAAVRKDRERLAHVLAAESAKPLKYALAEIDRAVQTFIIASEESKRLPKEYMSLDWTPAGEGKEGIVKYFPIGLVAGISPFNFPMNLSVHKIAPAIAAGCPIILKPASSTPLSTLELARIIDQTALPKGAVSIIPMNRTAGNLLVTDERFNLLSFTGSPEVGWEMKKNAGMKKVVLELGGNAAVIVSPSADIELAAHKSAVAGFAYSGQVCIHAQRFYVHEQVYDNFLEKLIGEIKKLKYGDPEDPETGISVMIDQSSADRVEEWVNEAASQGAKLLFGGRKNENYMEPTILGNTNSKMKVWTEEIFGPVITVDKFSVFEKAVESVNDTRFGLQAGVFTGNIREMDYAFNNIEAGGVLINDVPTLRLDHMPYGGVKNSGLGREGVRYAIQDMLEPRIMIK